MSSELAEEAHEGVATWVPGDLGDSAIVGEIALGFCTGEGLVHGRDGHDAAVGSSTAEELELDG